MYVYFLFGYMGLFASTSIECGINSTNLHIRIEKFIMQFILCGNIMQTKKIAEKNGFLEVEFVDVVNLSTFHVHK